MKTNLIALALVAMAAIEQMITWAVAAAFLMVLFLYIRLRMSDPITRVEQLTDECRRLLSALADEKSRVMELTNRNDELRTINNRLQSELNEVRAGMRELKAAFEKNGETIARLSQDLKEEREKRDEQFMQWTRERAKHGEL